MKRAYYFILSSIVLLVATTTAYCTLQWSYSLPNNSWVVLYPGSSQTYTVQWTGESASEVAGAEGGGFTFGWPTNNVEPNISFPVPNTPPYCVHVVKQSSFIDTTGPTKYGKATGLFWADPWMSLSGVQNYAPFLTYTNCGGSIYVFTDNLKRGCSPSVGNPVDAQTCSKVINEDDALCGSINLSRKYSQGVVSMSDTANYRHKPFGTDRWTHGWNIYLFRWNTATEDTLITIENNNWALYKRINGTDNYFTDNGSTAQLSRVTGGKFHLKKADGTRYCFKTNGDIDSIIYQNGRYHTMQYGGDNYLRAVKNETGDSIVLRYSICYWHGNSVNVLSRVFRDSSQLYYQYKYVAINTGMALNQVLVYTPGNSIKAISRYYYEDNISTRPGRGFITIYQHGDVGTDTTYNGDRLCIWYGNDNRVLYEEMIKGDDDAIAINDKVVYKSFFSYIIGDKPRMSTGTKNDTLDTYYWEDTLTTFAHDPADTTFNPSDSIASWTSSGHEYFKHTYAFHNTGPVRVNKIWTPSGDSSVTISDSLDTDYNVRKVTDANGGQTIYNYPAYTLPNDNTTRYWPSPSKIKYANGDSVLTFFSAKGDSNRRLADSTRDELGNRTWNYYDSTKNYLDTAVVYKSRVLADGDTSHHDITTRYHYYAVGGNLKETLDPLGHKTRMYYVPDSAGLYMSQQRIVMSSDTGSTDIVTKYGYNTSKWALDTMTFYRDYPNNPSYTYYTYDQLNRAVKTVYPDTAKDSTVYDLRGNVLKKYTIKTDTLSKTVYEYNPHDLLAKVKEFRQPKDTPSVYDSTLYYYNLHDRLVTQINPLGKATNYTYVMDRLRKIAYPDTTKDSLGYYADGSLKFKIDRKGQVTVFIYDGTSSGCGCPNSSRYRLVLKKYYSDTAHYHDQYNYAHPAERDSFVYDKVGNRIKMIDTLGISQYAYDGLYRLKTDSCGYLNTKINYEYDQAGNRTRMKVTKGDSATVVYLDQTYSSYDNANRVGTTTISGKYITFTYWDTGTPKLITSADTVWENYTLTPRGVIDSVNTMYYDPDLVGHKGTWFKNKYTYNGLGDRTSHYLSLTRPGTSVLSGTINYAYDGMRRLKQTVYPAGMNNGMTVSCGYDKAGNRTRIDNDSWTHLSSNNEASNQLTKVKDYDTQTDLEFFRYDDNGNLACDSVLSGSKYYYYTNDFENRITKVKQSTDSTVFYYNGDGVRLKKDGTKDTALQYIHDGMYAAVERRTNGNLKYKYVYANGMLLARVDSAGTIYYYSHDALGSVIGATSTTAVYKAFLYDEFGDSLGAWGSTKINNYRYTGQEYDITPVNAYNLRAREYYPKLGRFLQNDPIGDKGGSLNWYSYVANNPINRVDPTGLFAWYQRYGHYCGPGQDPGRPAPIDALDAACQIHDDCYGKLNLGGPIGVINSFLPSSQACGREQCDKALCEAAKNFKIPYTDQASIMAARNARGLVILIFCSGTTIK